MRPGVADKFPPVKKFLKGYVLGPDSWESEDLVQLQRYAREGRFEYPSAYDGQPRTFSFTDAGTALARVGIALRWLATQAALKQEAGFEPVLIRSAAYRYWAERVQHRFDRFMLQDFQSGGRPQYLPMLRFQSAVSCLAHVFLLGWQDWALALNRQVLASLNGGGYFDADEAAHPRAQCFVLKLLSVHFGLEYADQRHFTRDEPVYGFLSEHWRTEDTATLQEALLAALDRHTHQSVRPKRNGPAFDFSFDEDWYFPYEVLVVLKLREMAGLPNPPAEALAHPLTGTALGRLPPATPVYSEDTLDGVVLRLREEFADV